MSDYAYHYGDTLAHHGTKGQRWGVRQYQNLDGSLTPLGRIHYGVGAVRNKAKTTAGNVKTAIRKKVAPTNAELNAAIRKQKAKNDYKAKREELKRLKKTGINESTKDPDGKNDKGQHRRFADLSDQQLNDRINRLKKEIELADLERTKNMGPGKRMVDRAVRAGLETGIKNVTNLTVTKLGKEVVDGVFDGFKESSSSDESKSEAKSKSETLLDRQLDRAKEKADKEKKRESIAKANLDAQKSKENAKKAKEELRNKKKST